MRQPTRITATVPFDYTPSKHAATADKQLAGFMERAQNRIVDIGLLNINRTNLKNVERIMVCFDLELADTTARGYCVPVRNRDCAERLLQAGLLDQPATDIIRRWGTVTPSIRGE